MGLKEEFEAIRQQKLMMVETNEIIDEMIAEDNSAVNDLFPIDEKTATDHDPEDDEGTEVEEVEGFNLLILTSSTDSKNRKMSKKNPTIIKMEEHCQKQDIPYYTAFADTAYIEKDDDGVIKIYNVGDEEGFVIDRDRTMIFARRGVLFHKYSLNIMALLERYRFCFLNEKHGIMICEDKNLTHLKLIEAKLPIPATALVPTEEMLEIAHRKVGGKFPVVVKILNGTQGRGVFIANDMKSLKSTLQAMWAVGDDVEMMLQKFIKSEFDVRIHVLGDKVIGCMKREVIKDDFRSNVHLGGKPSKYKPSKEVQQLAIKAAKAVKCKWVGVDIMFDQRGNPYILEVNASPGTDGIEEVTKDDIVQKVLDYMKNGMNWTRPPQEVGVLEVVDIDGIGELVARFDTGNAANSISLDAQDVNISGDTITWTTNGKKMKGSRVGHVNIKSNVDASKDIEKRPVVALNVVFEGVVYKDVLFNLNDRSHKTTPVLINKDFMIRSGSVVNPARIFAVTVKPEKLKKKKIAKTNKDDNSTDKTIKDEDREN